MPTSVYFNNYKASTEQDLLTNLITESIKTFGIDVWYIPREVTHYDGIFTEDTQSSYTEAYLIEMYIRSVDGFSGDGQFISRFGIEIRDQLNLIVSRKAFEEEVTNQNAQLRPNEGDLIYFPLNGTCFQIKFVNKFDMMYPLGKLHTWELKTEVFEWSNEHVKTGIDEIDSIFAQYSSNQIEWALQDENGNPLLTENGSYIVQEGHSNDELFVADEGSEIEVESNEFIDFSETNPFGEQ